MTTNLTACPECGALREQHANKCVLCGFDYFENDSSAQTKDSPIIQDDGAHCQRCGNDNPEGARYCNKCGEILAVRLPDTKESTDVTTAADSAMKRQVGLLLGTSIGLVVALLAVSIWSDARFKPKPESPSASTESTTTAPAANVTLGVLPVLQQSSLDSLNQLIDSSSDPNERLALMKESVDFMVGNGRYDYAGIAQEQIAKELNNTESWGRAGTFYLTWMDRQPGGEERTSWARKAVGAFQSALDIDPDDLDIRTDMAFAYLNDPENPMEAIQQTNLVLESDSLHPQANFNRGLMLAQINRLDQAVVQFQKVIRISQPGTIIHDRSTDILNELQSR